MTRMQSFSSCTLLKHALTDGTGAVACEFAGRPGGTDGGRIHANGQPRGLQDIQAVLEIRLKGLVGSVVGRTPPDQSIHRRCVVGLEVNGQAVDDDKHVQCRAAHTLRD